MTVSVELTSREPRQIWLNDTRATERFLLPPIRHVAHQVELERCHRRAVEITRAALNFFFGSTKSVILQLVPPSQLTAFDAVCERSQTSHDPT